ncbi:hypothetical protein [Corynebacterium riegelii]|uniref:hypothetical protein n=1 Tax=Corynebacterium riegelii TaxID=156976 RepID=UPI0023F01B9C|nr:hypothetical protein [Corynebacterium riegelii]MDK7179862.1 hypothetical protein [Corynebacterium riegelii]
MARQAHKQVQFKVGEDEVVLADVTAPVSDLIFPLLELILITGICWIAIGWMDVTATVPLVARNAMVILWLVLGFWRFGVPVIRGRRRRFVVTDRRVLARGRTGKVDSIPHSQIHSVRRNRGELWVGVYGYPRPIRFEQVGKTRALEKLLQSQLRGGF